MVLAASGIVLWAFIGIEARAPNALLPLDLARSGRFVGASLVALVLTATTTPPLFVCGLYLQHVRDMPPTLAGIAFAPVNLAVIVGSVVGPHIVGRVGNRRAMAIGLVMVAAGATAIGAVLDVSGRPLAALVAAFVVLGGGLGAASVASTAEGIAAAGDERGGVASGILNTAAQIGTAVGLAVLVSLAAARSDALSATMTYQEALVGGYRWAAVAAALVAGCAGTVLSWPRRD